MIGRIMCYTSVIAIAVVQLATASPTFIFPKLIDDHGNPVQTVQLNEDLTCIPLEECSALVWLINNVTSIKGVSEKMASDALKAKRCVIDEINSEQELTLKTRVACPTIHDFSVDTLDEDEDDYNSTLTIHEDDYEIRSAFEFHFKKRVNLECSLHIEHGHIIDPLSDMEIKSLTGKRKKYPNLKRLSKRRILRITADGLCCWQIYTHIHFGGDSTFIEPDDEIFPELLIKSTQQVECTE